MVCERVLGGGLRRRGRRSAAQAHRPRECAQPFAEAGDLGTIRRALRRNQPITQAGSLIDPIAAIARMVAKTAGYQQVDLALDQLVQSGGLRHPKTDFRMRVAKLRQLKSAQVEAAMDRRSRKISGVRRLAQELRIRPNVGCCTRSRQ